MRVLVLFAHPVETSFQAALHQCVVTKLQEQGHEVDDCDLYAEDFDPRLSREERLNYHNLTTNQTHVSSYVKRLQAAEALVVVTPVWNFGHPAILKGFFDRIFLPGVSFDMIDQKVCSKLNNIKKIAFVTTYGAPRWQAFLIGDPPRKFATRVLKSVCRQVGSVHYLAKYDMNRSTAADRQIFLENVKRDMRHFQQ